MIDTIETGSHDNDKTTAIPYYLGGSSLNRSHNL
jgi:hypothetical protein